MWVWQEQVLPKQIHSLFDKLIEQGNKGEAAELACPNLVLLSKSSQHGISTRKSGKQELQWMKNGIWANNLMPRKQMSHQDEFLCHRQGSVYNLLL